MRQYLLLALLGLALARVDQWNKKSGIQEWDDYSEVEKEVHTQRDIKDTAFRPGREYRFFYDGQVMNGIPRSSKQHSATRIQALVRLQMESQDTMIMQLERIRMGKLNRRVWNPRRRLPFRAFQPVQIEEQFQQQLEMPVKFQYTNGLVKNIVHEKRDQTISINIKKGILNLLQVNTQEQGSTETTDQRLTNDVAPQLGRSKFFRAMEKTIEGECETIYTITKLPRRIQQVFYQDNSEEEEPMKSQPRLNVTKSINFERCNQRPTVRYNFRNSEQCKSCDPKFQENNKYLKSSSVMRYNLLGNRRNFLVEWAGAESQHSVEFYSEAGSFINVYVNQTLNLFKTGPINKPIEQQETSTSEPEMLYSQHWDVLNERFMLNSESGYPRQLHNKRQNFVEQVTELLKKLAQVVESNRNQPVSILAVNKYQLLVAALRKATPEELTKLHQAVYENAESLGLEQRQQKVIQDILEPATATAGTEAAIRHLARTIKQKKQRRSVSVSALRQLMNARVVSSKAVNQIKELCQESHVKSNQQLKQSCYLALGSLMKAACNSHQDKLAVDQKSTESPRCSVSEKRQWVEFLVNKVKSTEKWENKILYLKSLANAGLDLSVFELQKIIQNQQQFQPAYVRYEAIVALRQLTSQMPQKVQKILMPIYMNPREPSGLRQVAAYFILQSQPDRSVLDLMAKQVDNEPIRQVAMFTYQIMSELANSTNPCQEKLAADLKLSLRLARRRNPSIFDSKAATSSWHSLMRKVGLDTSLFELVANNTLFPKTIGGSLSNNLLGFYNKDLFTAAINMEGIERLIPKLWQNDGTYSWSNLLSRHPRDVSNYKQQLRNIFEKLNIKSRYLPREAKAYGYWRFHQQEIGFLPVTEDLVDYIKENGYMSKAEWEQSMRSGRKHHLNWHHAFMLEDAEAKVPTTLGLPLILKHKLPVLVKAEGWVQGQLSADNKQITLESNLRPSIAMKSEHTAEVWSPAAPSGARVRAQLRAQLPIVGKLEYNRQSHNMKVKLEAPTQQKELLRLDTQPITFTRQQNSQRKVYKEATEKVVQSEEINRVQKSQSTYQPAGLRFKVNTRYTPSLQEPQGNWVPMCPLSGPNHFSLRAMPPADNTKEIELVVNPAGSWRLNEPLKAKFLKNWEQESESSSASSEETEQSTFNSNRKRMGQLVAELKTKGGSQPRHYKANLKASFNPRGHAGQMEIELSRMSPQPYQICLHSEILYPSEPFERKQLKGKKVIKQTELRWGQTCQSNNYVTISAAAERTRQQERFERQNMEAYHECKIQESQSPIACYDYLRQAGFMNKYTFTVKYNNVPVSVQNATDKAWRALKTWYYPNTDVANVHVRNPANKIRAVFKIDPQDRTRVNATVKTPKQNVTMTDIYTPIRIPRVNVKRSLWASAMDQVSYNLRHNTFQFNPTCKVHTNNIRTFDGQRYHAPLTQCYSVVAKDCSEEQRFAVLVKKAGPDSNEKIVKIITQTNEIKLKSQGGNFKVVRNGSPFNVHEEDSNEEQENTQVRCQKHGSYVSCRIQEAGVKVYFDGQSANVKVSNLYVGKLCGLCGHMNYDDSDDFQTPDFQPQSDLRKFQRGYIYEDEECEANTIPQTDEFCPNERCQYQSEYEPTESDESSQERISHQHRHHYKRQHQQKPRKLNRIMQKMGQHCFSKEALPQCPDYTYPQEATQQEVDYTCLEEDDQQAQEFLIQAETTPIPELKSKPTTFTRMEVVPNSCKQQDREYFEEDL